MQCNYTVINLPDDDNPLNCIIELEATQHYGLEVGKGSIVTTTDKLTTKNGRLTSTAHAKLDEVKEGWSWKAELEAGAAGITATQSYEQNEEHMHSTNSETAEQVRLCEYILRKKRKNLGILFVIY